MPSISRNPPTASSANSQVAPWSTAPNGNNMTNNSVWSSFFNDSNEDVSQSSPGFRPGTGTREDSMGFPMKDDRRPSVASATTVSSTGSKSSMGRNFHKRLQNVFGEDFPADDRQNSDSSLGTPQRNRGNSLSNTIGSKHQSRPTSPTSSRPRTPQASSEVTPWEFQDSKVSLVHIQRKALRLSLMLLPYYSTADLGPVSLTPHRTFPLPLSMAAVVPPSNILPNRVDRITSCT